MTFPKYTSGAALVALLALLFAASASANEAYARMTSSVSWLADFTETDAREVDRDVADLPTEIRPRPIDVDVVDTALVFTNTANVDRRIVCVGFDKQGQKVGRVLVKLPALGLRYVLASDLADGQDFVGSAQCATHATVRGSAIFLGPSITDLSVDNIAGRWLGRIRFHVVATY